ncbi:MAG TPA: ATP-binding cassette domain-containing protein [Pseudomonadales bacterium]
MLSIHDLHGDCLAIDRLDIAAGEIVCLSGPSGSGKSRLLRAIADLDPHNGLISLNHQSQCSMPAHHWRRRVMLVPADSQWWADTVVEHFADGAVDLAALGLPADAGQWPVSRLSAGERQRLALARAISYRPQALLLDEPTANLDPETTAMVERWLQQQIATGQLPTLWVSHDTAQIARLGNRHLRIHRQQLEPVA